MRMGWRPLRTASALASSQTHNTKHNALLPLHCYRIVYGFMRTAAHYQRASLTHHSKCVDVSSSAHVAVAQQLWQQQGGQQQQQCVAKQHQQQQDTKQQQSLGSVGAGASIQDRQDCAPEEYNSEHAAWASVLGWGYTLLWE